MNRRNKKVAKHRRKALQGKVQKQNKVGRYKEHRAKGEANNETSVQQ
jgi:hypothetical protein